MALTTSKATDGAVEKALPPNQSLYLQNLPEKIKKDDLKCALYMLFTIHGPVLDIVAMRTTKMRGQAHVVFRDVASATQAMRHCQGYDFFGRPMIISYAKSRSHKIAKLTGTFYEPASQGAKAEAGDAKGQAPSAFPAPPGMQSGPPTGFPAPPGSSAPARQQAGNLQPPPQAAPQDSPSPSGTKRARDESDDEEGAPMEEEDDDSGAEMDMSDDD